MKTRLIRNASKTGMAVALVAELLLPVLAHAGKIQGARVTYGSASFRQSGNTYTVQASNRVVIDYTQFDVTRGQFVIFKQPSAQSTILNRIDSATPSSIDGSISANGIVYFVNPSGIAFGPHANVNAGGLIAAAGNLSTSSFVAGGSPVATGGAVTNDGSIHAGAVQLAGKQVTNTGTIVASGVATMTSGETVYLGNPASGLMVKAPVAKVATGPGSLASGDIYSLAIRQTGSVAARNITLQAASGQVQVSGSLNASSATPGSKGGTVKVLSAGAITLTGATINASGPAGGGTILVGGDRHGATGTVSSGQTSVDSASKLVADATKKGDGGEVVVRSNSNTGFHGSISARGGSTGGDGGFVETSGGKLDISGGTVVASSGPGGRPGTWLLDPIDVFIDDPSDIPASDGTVNSYPIPPNPADITYINVKTIDAALNSGMNVTIDASVGADLTAGVTYTLKGQSQTDTTGLGQIFIRAPIIKDAGGDATLTLIGPGGVTFQGPVKQYATLSADGTTVSQEYPLAASQPDGSITVIRNYSGGITCTSGKLNVNLQTNDAPPIFLANPAVNYYQIGTINILGGPIQTNGGSFTATVFNNATVVSNATGVIATPIANPMAAGANNSVRDMGATIPPADYQPFQGSSVQFVSVNARLANSPVTSLIVQNLAVEPARSFAIPNSAINTGGGSVTIAVPRTVLLDGTVTTGGGNLTIDNTGDTFPLNGSIPILDSTTGLPTGGVDFTDRPSIQIYNTLSTSGGSITLNSYSSIYLSQALTGGGAFISHADVANKDELSAFYLTDPPAGISLVANSPAISTGTGAISITSPQIDLFNTPLANVPAISGGQQTYTAPPRDSIGGSSLAYQAPASPSSINIAINTPPFTPGVPYTRGAPYIIAGTSASAIAFDGPVIAGPRPVFLDGSTSPIVPLPSSAPPLAYPVLNVRTSGQRGANIYLGSSVGGTVNLDLDAGKQGDVLLHPANGAHKGAYDRSQTFAVGEVPILNAENVTPPIPASGESGVPTYLNESVESLTIHGNRVMLGSVASQGPITVSANSVEIAGSDAELFTKQYFDFSQTPITSPAFYGGRVPIFGNLGYPTSRGDAEGNLGSLDRQGASITQMYTVPKLDANGNPIPNQSGSSTILIKQRVTFNIALPNNFVTQPTSIPGLVFPIIINGVIPEGTQESAAGEIAGAVPHTAPKTVSSPAVVSSLKKDLANLGIHARDVSIDEKKYGFTVGLSFYNDHDAVPGNPDPLKEHTIAAERIPFLQAMEAIRRYKALRYKTVIGEDGKPAEESQFPQLRESLKNTWRAYNRTLDNKSDGAGFRTWLANDSIAQTDDGRSAAAALDGLHGLIISINALGLDPVYENDSKRTLIHDVKPPGMSQSQFAKAIEAAVAVGARRDR